MSAEPRPPPALVTIWRATSTASASRVGGTCILPTAGTRAPPRKPPGAARSPRAWRASPASPQRRALAGWRAGPTRRAPSEAPHRRPRAPGRTRLPGTSSRRTRGRPFAGLGTKPRAATSGRRWRRLRGADCPRSRGEGVASRLRGLLPRCSPGPAPARDAAVRGPRARRSRATPPPAVSRAPGAPSCAAVPAWGVERLGKPYEKARTPATRVEGRPVPLRPSRGCPDRAEWRGNTRHALTLPCRAGPRQRLTGALSARGHPRYDAQDAQHDQPLRRDGCAESP